MQTVTMVTRLQPGKRGSQEGKSVREDKHDCLFTQKQVERFIYIRRMDSGVRPDVV